jgi:hypothetical protein
MTFFIGRRELITLLGDASRCGQENGSVSTLSVGHMLASIRTTGSRPANGRIGKRCHNKCWRGRLWPLCVRGGRQAHREY